MHRLLEKQIRKHVSDESLLQSLDGFLQTVEEAYNQADQDRDTLKRSLDHTSSELLNRYEQLEKKVAELEEAKAALQQTVSTLNATLESSGEGVLVLDKDCNVINFNQKFLRLWDISSAEALNNDLTDIIQVAAERVKDKEEFLYRIEKGRELSPQEEVGQLMELKDGRIIERHSRPQVMSGEIVGRVWSFRDITEIKRNEALVHHQAHHDFLTGLPNRLLFHDRLEHSLHRARRNGKKVAVCFIDMDGFKHINDSLGHGVGDKLLHGVADRIQCCIRAQETLARVGGDEFMVLIEDLDEPNDAVMVADRIFTGFQRPFIIEDRELYLTSSMGLSVFPIDSEEPQTLIRKADIAMSDAKSKGKNNIQLFNPDLEKMAVKRMNIETELRSAVRNGDFYLLYQPKTNMALDEIVGLEALIRWRHEKLGTVPPIEFIPVAEDTGLILDIGAWILEEVCEQIHRWRHAGLTQVPVAINMSVRELQQPNISKTMLEIVKGHGISPDLIEVEVTESLLMDNLEQGVTTLQNLRDAGFHVSVDDFGTGHSSLGYLKHLPVDKLKVDRAFIKDISMSKKDAAIADSIINLGHNLGLDVVAEGVEDLTSVEILRQFRCDQLQGYFFSAPLQGEKLKQLLRQYRPGH